MTVFKQLLSALSVTEETVILNVSITIPRKEVVTILACYDEDTEDDALYRIHSNLKAQGKLVGYAITK